MIIIIPHENVRFAILYQAGTVTNVMRISVIFIFMMKTTKNYAVLEWIISIFSGCTSTNLDSNSAQIELHGIFLKSVRGVGFEPTNP